MAEIVNFNKAKKARARAEKAKDAAESRAKSAQSKAEKTFGEAERERRDHALDNAKRDEGDEPKR